VERRGLPGHDGSEALTRLQDSPLLQHPALHLLLRLFLGGFFLYAAVPKILDPAAFARVVYQWQITPPVPSNVVAVVLPWVEGIAGVLLIAGIWKREAAATIAVLLVVFLLAASSVIWRGIDVENCGCTSVAAHAEKSWTTGVGWFLVTRNLLMLAGALVLAWVTPRAAAAALPVSATAPGASAPR
jgi:putative oxidoreductase